MMGYGRGMGPFGLMWPLGGLLFLVLVIVLVVLAVRYFTRVNPPGHGPWTGPQTPLPPVPPVRPEPLDILRERFARGDITLDEFETAKRALGYSSSPTPPPPGPGTPSTG
jgi:putative membrane protein